MTYKINSVYDLGRKNGLEEGETKGDRNRLRDMLKKCITLRFPQTSQTTISNILSIPDDFVLESIFKVACTADSLDNFQRGIRGMAPVN